MFIRTCISVIIILMMLFSIVFAQNSNVDQEILVMFKPGVIELPNGKSDGKIGEFEIAVPAIQKALQTQKAELGFQSF